MYIPDEMGRIPRLRVLNLSDNKIRYLPYSLTRLKELQALWLSENQVCNTSGAYCDVHQVMIPFWPRSCFRVDHPFQVQYLYS